jgi:hypothetical protein
MIEQITLSLATPIARIILDKLYEGIGSKLGEKVVEAAAEPIKKLGQAVWNRCFKEQPGTQKVLGAAAQGSAPALQQIRESLLKEMEHPEFMGMVQPIAQEIHQVIVQMDEVNARNVQQIARDGFQNIETQGTIIQGVTGSPITITTNNNYSDKSSD